MKPSSINVLTVEEREALLAYHRERLARALQQRHALATMEIAHRENRIRWLSSATRPLVRLEGKPPRHP